VSVLKRYSRQILLPEVGEAGQEKLLVASVAVIGCGALGTVVASSIVRAGVGRVKIVDRDYIELKSGQRLEGAVDYLQRMGMEEVRAHERELTEYALPGLQAIPGVQIYGSLNLDERTGVIAFNVIKDGELVDPHIVAGFLNDEGIAVRSGGHCAYPLTDRLGVEGTVRVSFYIYNTKGEVDRFLEVLEEIVRRRLF
jgi:selenocysteine lyase/cysteine desulfurase